MTLEISKVPIIRSICDRRLKIILNNKQWKTKILILQIQNSSWAHLIIRQVSIVPFMPILNYSRKNVYRLPMYIRM